MPRTQPVPQSPESIAHIAGEIADTAVNLRAVSEQMATNGFGTLEISNYDQARRAMEYIENFLAACRLSLRQAREARGDFRADANGAAEKPVKRQKKDSKTS